MRLLVTSSFERTTKKLHKQQKTGLDVAVRSIVVANPEIGEEKNRRFGRYQNLQI